MSFFAGKWIECFIVSHYLYIRDILHGHRYKNNAYKYSDMTEKWYQIFFFLFSFFLGEGCFFFVCFVTNLFFKFLSYLQLFFPFP